MADSDRLRREIEDVLNRLDTFLPEERPPERIRRTSSDFLVALRQTLFAMIAPLTRISLRQLMLTALALIVVAFFAMRVHPLFARWVIIAGLILFFTSFGLSLFTRGSRPAGPRIEKRWRGQPLELDEPTLGERLRAWFQSRRRPPHER